MTMTNGPARFREQTVVVTGASRGLGRDLAVAFGREGAHVVVGYCQHAAEAEETAVLVRSAGGEVTCLVLDVREATSVETFFDTVRATRGQLDVLVNNAAVVHEGPFPLLDDDAWEDTVATNLVGTARCARAAAKLMWRRARGTIVNVASVSAVVATPGLCAYAASKGAIVAFTRNLAAELGPKGIRVNRLCRACSPPEWARDSIPSW